MSALVLNIASPNAPPAYHHLSNQPLILGRAHDSHICLDSRTISRRHAQLAPDPFGRWWIRDLGSHNGTLVNGNRVTESLLKPGDLVQLGEFSLSLSPLDEPPNLPPCTTAPLSLVENDHGQISSMRDFEPPRLAATHLSILSDFGQQLLTLDTPAARLLALCRLMVRPEFHALAAHALRASKETFSDPPKPLCEPQFAPGQQTLAPYISKSLIRALLALNEPILASNCNPRGLSAPPMSQPPNLAELSLSSDILSIAAIACPLQSQPAYTDLLYVLLPPECGTSEWLALTSLAAKQFLHAESTWAARKLGEDHASIERELARARDIQKRLVPRNILIPGLDYAIGFTPCRWVGGDYVDLIPSHLAPGSPGLPAPTAEPPPSSPNSSLITHYSSLGTPVLLTIADVCGKGLPAALVASSLHMLTHTAMRSRTPLPDIMRNLNVYLAENLPDGTFVTMLAALLNPATGALQIINAGHPAGFLVAPDGTLRQTQHSANLPLGIDPNAELVPDTTTLDPGSYLVMFTDGLSELRLEGGELLGEGALAAHISRLIRSHHNSANAILPIGDSPAPSPHSVLSPQSSELRTPASALAANLTALLDSLHEGIATDDRTFLLARRL